MPDHSTYEAWDLEALSDIPNYQEWILSAFRPYLRGNAVEIGAGTGTFSRLLLDHVQRLELIEPVESLVRQLNEEFSGKSKASTIAKTVESYLTDAQEATRDSIIMVNVLEHIEDDRAVMTGLYRLLKPGGHLLLFVPALPRLFSAMDTALGHYRRYRKDSLVGLAKNAGFKVVSVRYFDILGVVPWWIVYTIGGKTRFDPGLAKLYDRLGVPLGRALESVLPPPFGKNALLIAEKLEPAP